eukprot:TRINITY_DN5893_c0_g2_i2.p1 TRINITY_DN5893_c0_g2~~TRINITY_DN5893_c0_g2_i2.p1  ORF type:complete len:357 (+),score=121.50 TRINITY_DN5893_c0_g2_i2:59-1072(+)
METQGGIDDLSPKDNITIPEPAEGQVRVKVMAAGMNMSDVRRIKEAGIPFPAAAGLDGAGVIHAIGPDTQAPFPVGARVYFTCDGGKPYGTLAEYTLVDTDRLFIMQPSVSFVTAASLPSAGWAAHLAVHTKLRVQKGRTVYITGGAGGVGGFAADLCKAAGLTVITSCSSYNADYVRERGADHVLDYTSDDIPEEVSRITNGKGVDYVLDTVSSESASTNAALLAYGGHICSANGQVRFTQEMVGRGVSVHYVSLNGLLTSAHHKEELRALADTVMHLTSEGRLKEHVGEVGKWEFVREALHTIELGFAKNRSILFSRRTHCVVVGGQMGGGLLVG